MTCFPASVTPNFGLSNAIKKHLKISYKLHERTQDPGVGWGEGGSKGDQQGHGTWPISQRLWNHDLALPKRLRSWFHVRSFVNRKGRHKPPYDACSTAVCHVLRGKHFYPLTGDTRVLVKQLARFQGRYVNGDHFRQMSESDFSRLQQKLVKQHVILPSGEHWIP